MPLTSYRSATGNFLYFAHAFEIKEVTSPTGNFLYFAHAFEIKEVTSPTGNFLSFNISNFK